MKARPSFNDLRKAITEGERRGLDTARWERRLDELSVEGAAGRRRGILEMLRQRLPPAGYEFAKELAEVVWEADKRLLSNPEDEDLWRDRTAARADLLRLERLAEEGSLDGHSDGDARRAKAERLPAVQDRTKGGVGASRSDQQTGS